MKNKHYDIKEPSIGHFERFQAKLAQQEKPKKQYHWYKYIAIAASFVLLFSFGFSKFHQSKSYDLADISPKMEETQDYFNAVIHQELEKISKEKNEDNKQIIEDALLQLKNLETDYNQQKKALKTNTKNKNVIYSMINNYQQRIEVLQNLLQELNKFDHLKNNYNEINSL